MTTDIVLLVVGGLVYVPMLVFLAVGAARRAYLRAGCEFRTYTLTLEDGTVVRSIRPASPATPKRKIDEEQ